MLFSFVCGLVGGLVGSYGSHYARLKTDETYRDSFLHDQQAQTLLPSFFLTVSATNGCLTSALCWFVASLPAVQVGAGTGLALGLFMYWMEGTKGRL
jgi:hypothetical protein